MILFTNTFIKSANDKPSELIALLISGFMCFVFVVLFALCFEPNKPQPQILIPAPSPTPTLIAIEKPPDPNKEFRVVPENFAHIDFKNWSYGRYRFGGSNITLTLSDGEKVYPSSEGGGDSFWLNDVFYTDVTGDGKPEAIVMLSHVGCGVSCDGGSDLIYVYQDQKGNVRKIWEYETGSMAYGCGLKSFTVRNQQISLEMFGQCWQPASSFEVSGKFLVRDLTLSVFHYNGTRFVKQRTEISAAPVKNLRNYTPEIHIEN